MGNNLKNLRVVLAFLRLLSRLQGYADHLGFILSRRPGANVSKKRKKKYASTVRRQN